MKISLSIKGVKALKKAAEKMSQQMDRAAAAAIYQAGYVIMNESQKIVPVDYNTRSSRSKAVKGGRLKKSGYVGTPIFGRNGPLVRLGYGTRYAWFVHEMPTSYNFTRPGSGPKYLERPLYAFSGRYLDFVKKKTADNFKRGIGFQSVRSEFKNFVG